MKQNEVEVERLRIWDFYLAFPGEARNITFPSSLIDLKKVFKTRELNPYEDLIDPKKIFERMRSYQILALRCIASYGFIDGELLGKNIVKLTGKDFPQELINQFAESSVEKKNVMKLIAGFNDILLLGDSGLKSRTGLLEFRYDPK